jgi:hypothetical protein
MTAHQFLFGLTLIFTAALFFTAGALYQLQADHGLITVSAWQNCR